MEDSSAIMAVGDIDVLDRDLWVGGETTAGQGIPLIEYEECLVERKWWCFLLSSIFTFILGLLSVVLTRVVQRVFFKDEAEDVSEEDKLRYE